jgi:hypothetical protein
VPGDLNNKYFAGKEIGYTKTWQTEFKGKAILSKPKIGTVNLYVHTYVKMNVSKALIWAFWAKGFCRFKCGEVSSNLESSSS